MVNDARRPHGRNRVVGGRHSARRDGVVAVVLFVLPGVAALGLVRTHHHLDVAAVTVLVSVALGLPVLWLSWATYRAGRRSEADGGGPGLAELADQLAVAVDAQWQAEAAVRRLN